MASSSAALYQKHIHLIGIGGAGLSAIARVLLERGAAVSGSDQRASPVTAELSRAGAVIHIGHAAAQVAGADLVVVSSAVPPDNPEVQAARERGIPVLKRAEFIGQLTADRRCIAVAGTHGKTTTTAMIAFILSEAGFSPGFIIGARSLNLGTNARAGAGDYFVIEADEYDRMFLGLRPEVAVVTNVELDHPDCFDCLDDVTQAFRQFLERVPAEGCIVANGDEGRITEMLKGLAVEKKETFGLSRAVDWRAADPACGAQGGYDFFLYHRATPLGPFSLALPGMHNVLNALAAIAAKTEVGIDLHTIQEELARFEGTDRRFEHKGTVGGITVVDDYAHHPTEIRATLAAARARYLGRPLWVVFQPHTYSRFKALLREFAQSFDLADHVIVTDIFSARESDTLGVQAADILPLLRHPDARYLSGFEEIVGFLQSRLRPGDVCITLGAGDCNLLGEMLLERLRAA